MTNNLEVDNRGFIYATDRNGFGLEILDLRGTARKASGRLFLSHVTRGTTG
jgi:hypothetical protein